MKTQKIFNVLKSGFFITLGMVLASIGWAAFIIPSKISGGGITGLSTLFYFATDIPVGYTVFVVNLFLVALAIKTLGPRFGIGSVVGIIVFSAGLVLFQKIFNKPIIDNNPFLSSIIGGVLSGFGTAIAFMYGGNGGGLDIIALVVSKYRNISPGRVIFYANMVIIASTYFLTHNVESVVYSYVVMVASTYMLDATLDGSRQSYQVTIISQNSALIADALTAELGRGVTILKGIGWYTKADTDVIIAIIHKNDLQPLHKILLKIDKNAFVSEAKVAAVFGRNFQQLKA